MTPEKKDIPEIPLRDTPVKDKNIEVLSMPGLSVNLQHAGDTLELAASGTLKAACSPILKKINSRLQGGKASPRTGRQSHCLGLAPSNSEPGFQTSHFCRNTDSPGKIHSRNRIHRTYPPEQFEISAWNNRRRAGYGYY